MDPLPLIRCQNLQRGIDELGNSDLFLQKYAQLFGADKALSANYLFKLLSGKIAIRDALAREIELILNKGGQWLDVPRVPVAAEQPFGTWPGVVTRTQFAQLSREEQTRMQTHVDELVEKWSVQDWRQARVITSGK
jgi:hypothetical protein